MQILPFCAPRPRITEQPTGAPSEPTVCADRSVASYGKLSSRSWERFGRIYPGAVRDLGRWKARASDRWRGRRAAAILAGMTNPPKWIAATSSRYGALSDPGRLTLATVAAWATAIAAFVAVVALVIASYTIWSSHRALIRERRLTFELGVLAQLAHACAHLFTGGEQNEALALTRLLPGKLEGLRRHIEEGATNGPGFSAGERVLSDHWGEYEQAVGKRLGRRR